MTALYPYLIAIRVILIGYVALAVWLCLTRGVR